MKKVFASLIYFVLFMLYAGSAYGQDFVLREHLGRNWTHELVTFSLNAAQFAAVKQGLKLLGQIMMCCQVSLLRALDSLA